MIRSAGSIGSGGDNFAKSASVIPIFPISANPDMILAIDASRCAGVCPTGVAEVSCSEANDGGGGVKLGALD